MRARAVGEWATPVAAHSQRRNANPSTLGEPPAVQFDPLGHRPSRLQSREHFEVLRLQ